MSGPEPACWLLCPGLQAPPRYLLFTPAAGAPGAHARAGAGWEGWLGISSGLALRGLPSLGLREKVPG